MREQELLLLMNKIVRPPVTTNVPVISDGFLWIALPNDNENSLDFFYSRGVGLGTANSIIKMDTSVIPTDRPVSSVKMYFYQYAASALITATISMYRILPANSTWSATGCKWNYKTGTTRWAGDVGNDGQTDAGCSVPDTDISSTSMGSFTVTAGDTLGKEYVVTLNKSEFGLMMANNNGFIMKSNVDNYSQFCSKEHATVAYRPKMVVVTGG